MTSFPTLRSLVLLAVTFAAAAGPGLAQGIEVKRVAVVLFGSVRSCSRPGTIDYAKVQKATPEYKTIRSDGVREGSARHDLLIAEMTSRIKAAVAKVAEAESCDCVVRSGDIKDENGLKVQDLTSEVIGKLDS